MPLPNNFDQHLAPIIRAEQSVLDTHLAFRKARGYGGTSYDVLVEAATDFVTGLCEDYLDAVERQRYFNSRRFSRLASDPSLRLNAALEVADREEFARQVEKGDRQINQMQDAKGNLLQDSYLMDLLEEQGPDLRTLYRRASGFVHLSPSQMEITRLGWEAVGRVGRLVPGRAELYARKADWRESAKDFLECVLVFQTVLDRCLREERRAGRP